MKPGGGVFRIFFVFFVIFLVGCTHPVSEYSDEPEYIPDERVYGMPIGQPSGSSLPIPVGNEAEGTTDDSVEETGTPPPPPPLPVPGGN
jgi:hypothetical protein